MATRHAKFGGAVLFDVPVVIRGLVGLTNWLNPSLRVSAVANEQQALTLLNQWSIDSRPVAVPSGASSASPPIEPDAVDERFAYEDPEGGFRVAVAILPGKVLHFVADGHAEISHVQHSIRLLQEAVATLPEQGPTFYVAGGTRLTRVSMAGRKAFGQFLRAQTNIGGFVVYGASLPIRTMSTAVVSLYADTRLRFVESRAEALDVVAKWRRAGATDGIADRPSAAPIRDQPLQNINLGPSMRQIRWPSHWRMSTQGFAIDVGVVDGRIIVACLSGTISASAVAGALTLFETIRDELGGGRMSLVYDARKVGWITRAARRQFVEWLRAEERPFAAAA
ncbi:MAG: hypothetical protein VB934_01705, partial [Polyangiaceae bacterium]